NATRRCIFFLTKRYYHQQQQQENSVHVQKSSGFNPFNDHKVYLDQVKNYINRLNPYQGIDLRAAQLNWDHILDPQYENTIAENIFVRKADANILHVHNLHKEIQSLIHRVEEKKLDPTQGEDQIKLKIQDLYNQAMKLPNQAHPDSPIGRETEARVIREVGEKSELSLSQRSIDEIGTDFDTLLLENMGQISFRGAYVLFNDFARLERALMYYAFQKLTNYGFKMVSVPDIIHRGIIESCGFPTQGKRTQVYQLDYGEEFGRYCLAGTSEMALAGLLKHNTFRKDELPLKLAACSRCYRAEVAGGKSEGSLYRVHEFTKVEMFCVTSDEPGVSDKMLEDIVNIQTDLFSELGLHFRILDMPTEELGLSAYRKHDIEAWMPAKQFYGEISSASNCSDFQSRRLHIKYIDDNTEERFAHTLNGTAMAIPRVMTALIETNWKPNGEQVYIPKPLQQVMGNREYITRSTRTPKTHWIKTFN
ncbi:unnamed protein product, partial [Didymodactylos carnosus]